MTPKGQLSYSYEKLVAIEEEILKKIATIFRPILEEYPYIIEFGITEEDEVILLDYVEEKKTVSSDNVLTGIISPGSIKGTFIDSSLLDLENKSFDYHQKNQIIENMDHKSGKIFWALRPSLYLTALIEEHGSKNIGFVFKEFSLINHFCIILREFDIPAVWIEQDVSNLFGKEIILDAEKNDIATENRLLEI